MLAATLVAVIVVLLVFVWPGFVSGPRCPGYSATTSANGRTYCYESVSLTGTPLNCPWQANGTWSGPSKQVDFGFTFHLVLYYCGPGPGVGGTAVSVEEGNGTTYWGGTGFGGSLGNSHSSWFAPDNRSGIYQPVAGLAATVDVTIYVIPNT